MPAGSLEGTMYQIIQKFIHHNRSGESLNAQGGVVHETAVNNDTDEGEESVFDRQDMQASAHAFIDSDSITQCIPWNEVAWGSGQTSNHRFWQIELCHTTDFAKFNEIWKRAICLFSYLYTTQANPPIKKVGKSNTWSHAEISNTFHETDHQDPVAYFASFGVTVDDFRAALQKCIDTGIIDDLQFKGGITVLKKGDNNTAVGILQGQLNKLGYNLTVDNDFGPGTEATVKDFQGKHGLTSDGIVGPTTQVAIDKAVQAISAPTVNFEQKYNALVADIKALIAKYNL